MVVAHDGFAEAQLAAYYETSSHPDNASLSEAFFRELQERRTHLTRTQPQLDPEGKFYGSNVRGLFEKAGICVVMLSHRPMSDGAQRTVCLYRKPGRPHFDAREARIAHIVLSEADWLHREDWSSEAPSLTARLSPRERQVFNLVLENLPLSSIVFATGLSRHTVGDHLKAVYRKLRVNSRAQLVARFLAGDGGDIQ